MRKILAVAAGMIAAIVVVALIEALGHFIYPPPPGIDLSDPEAIRSIINKMPLGALAFVPAAWALGAFAGSAVATWLARTSSMLPGLVVGAAVLGATLYTLTLFPHPAWMMALGVLLPLVSAWLGAKAIGTSR